MRIAITTPTGHIGGEVTRLLLSSGAKLVLLARNRNRVQEFERVGAQIRVGSQDNEKFVTEATVGADALLWVTPPNMACDNVRAFQAACGRAAAAVRANRISRVVNISSIGAQSGEGNGPINGLHDVELLLNAFLLTVALDLGDHQPGVPDLFQRSTYIADLCRPDYRFYFFHRNLPLYSPDAFFAGADTHGF